MRRFSDFLGLHDKLVEKHIRSGRIVPPAPEKSVIGEREQPVWCVRGAGLNRSYVAGNNGCLIFVAPLFCVSSSILHSLG